MRTASSHHAPYACWLIHFFLRASIWFTPFVLHFFVILCFSLCFSPLLMIVDSTLISCLSWRALYPSSQVICYWKYCHRVSHASCFFESVPSVSQSRFTIKRGDKRTLMIVLKISIKRKKLVPNRDLLVEHYQVLNPRTNKKLPQ